MKIPIAFCLSLFLILVGTVRAESVTKYFCCTREGFCGSRPFDDQATCTPRCPGHNECQPRRVDVSDVSVMASPTTQSVVAISPTDIPAGVVLAGSGVPVPQTLVSAGPVAIGSRVLTQTTQRPVQTAVVPAARNVANQRPIVAQTQAATTQSQAQNRAMQRGGLVSQQAAPQSQPVVATQQIVTPNQPFANRNLRTQARVATPTSSPVVIMTPKTRAQPREQQRPRTQSPIASKR